MAVKKIDGASYTKLRKNLIRQNGSGIQRDFLNALLDSARFVQWFNEEVQTTEGDDASLSLLGELSEGEYKEPPVSTERQIFETWKELKPADACQSAFWGWVTLRHIEEGKIKSTFLAGNDKATGLEHIERALKENESKKMDDVVRTALRRFSGLVEARGHRSVYANCSFARAWWRQYMANEVCESTPAERDNVMEVFRKSQSYWEELISSVVSKNSLLGDSKIRIALIWALSESVNDAEKAALYKANLLKNQIIKRIGIRSAWQELAIFSVEELKELMETKFMVGI